MSDDEEYYEWEEEYLIEDVPDFVVSAQSCDSILQMNLIRIVPCRTNSPKPHTTKRPFTKTRESKRRTTPVTGNTIRTIITMKIRQ